MTERQSEDFKKRLYDVAVCFVLPTGPRVDTAIVLAEDLVASGFSGPATVELAAMSRAALRSDAEPALRDMFAEHGIEIPDLHAEEAEYQLLLTAFGHGDLPFHLLEAAFYVRVPSVDEQSPLDRALLLLMERRDLESGPAARFSIEREMRGLVRAQMRVT